jgi:hypothetical protein
MALLYCGIEFVGLQVEQHKCHLILRLKRYGYLPPLLPSSSSYGMQGQHFLASVTLRHCANIADGKEAGKRVGI